MEERAAEGVARVVVRVGECRDEAGSEGEWRWAGGGDVTGGEEVRV